MYSAHGRVSCTGVLQPDGKVKAYTTAFDVPEDPGIKPAFGPLGIRLLKASVSTITRCSSRGGLPLVGRSHIV